MKKFDSLGRSLSKTEQKLIVGGYEELEPADGPGTCCAHNQDWSYQICGIDRATAQQYASQYAQNNGAGNRGMWCCSSC